MEDNLRVSVRWYARKILGVGVSVMMAFLFVISCHRDPDERLIKAILEQIRQSTEQKDFDACLTFVSEDYQDNLDLRKHQLKERLERAFLGYPRLEIHHGISKFEKQGSGIRVVLKFKITGVQGDRKERLFGGALLAKSLTVDFEKREGEWKVVNSTIEIRRGF